MAIPYETAIATLQGMFMELDREVICAVLESYNGHMERTVECLLSMTSEDHSNFSSFDSSPAMPVSQPPLPQRPQDLPELEQIKQDELLARMVQDAWLVEQFRDPQLFSMFSPWGTEPTSSSSSTVDEIDIADKIKQLGDGAKLKLKELILKVKNKVTSTGSPARSPGVKYSQIDNSQDSGEVVSFDTSISRRTAINASNPFTIDDEDTFEDEQPLTHSKKSVNIKKDDFELVGMKEMKDLSLSQSKNAKKDD